MPRNHRSLRFTSKLKNPFLASYPAPPCPRRVENLHPATLIAALAGGGILCVGPEGVRIFDEDGRPLLGGGGSRGQDLMVSVPVSAGCHCPWGANALAALTPVPNAAVGRGAQNHRGRGETMGETYGIRKLCGLTVLFVSIREKKLTKDIKQAY